MIGLSRYRWVPIFIFYFFIKCNLNVDFEELDVEFCDVEWLCCVHRFGTQLDKRDFRVLGLLSTEGQIAVF